ncbi:hypothetical protein J2W34_004363 [Variovorax boronicumulans]|uniref:hypothetical protein n=1 Tax=Variovorax boronicumulans TaxID=436515 RepID=UPI0027887EAC|nr:hypothetical protein [Variovorax boronicumulans]MDQ0072558.1 hypothetical protein [Variovorax boronicumulans]
MSKVDLALAAPSGDATGAIRAAASKLQESGGGRLLLTGHFKINVPAGESLVALKDARDVVIDASKAILDDSAILFDKPTFTPIFLFDGGENITVTIGEYRGVPLPDPQTQMGYRGAILVRAIKGAKGIAIDVARASNLRYGLQTGAYDDASNGQCSNIDVKIRGTMIGYSVAAYLADDLRFNVDIDGVHRAVYLGGCSKVSGVARWRDQYIAPIAVLLTDALAAGNDRDAQADPVRKPTRSRGCSEIDVQSIDKGSKIFQAGSVCAGIALSRVDPCVFRDIRIRVSSKGTDTVSTKVGAFHIYSGANEVWKRYPSNWRPEVVFENISVSGLIDHSESSLEGNGLSELSVKAYDKDPANAATFKNISFDGLTILPSRARQRALNFEVPGLAGIASFRGFRAPGMTLGLRTNDRHDSLMADCEFGELDVRHVVGGSRVVVGQGCVIGKETSDGPTSNTKLEGGKIGGP